MHTQQLIFNITKCPEEYDGAKHIDLPVEGGSIGRATGCSVTLTDSNRFISNVHGMITTYGSEYYFSDVSTNGTTINEQRIMANQPIPLCDGDLIALGRYEITIAIEQVSKNTDIAVDIEPNRDSPDPLENLGGFSVPRTGTTGIRNQNLNSIFLEREEQCEASEDPIEYLGQQENPESGILLQSERNTPSPKEVNHRQIVDDSNSIDAHFDSTQIIPDNWMENSSNSNREPQRKRASAGSPSTSKVQGGIASINSSRGAEKLSPVMDKNEENCLKEFAKGLGIESGWIQEQSPLFFSHLGKCLRICVNQLEDRLVEINQMKVTDDSSEEQLNILEVMLDLYRQNLLSPSELFEQVIEEVKLYESQYVSAINGALADTLREQMPIYCEENNGNTKRNFWVKLRLWQELKRVDGDRLLKQMDIRGQEVKEKIKQNYNQQVRDNYA